MTKDDKPMWIEYDLALEVETLVGGLPKHPEIVKRWQEAKWPTNPDRALNEGDPTDPVEAAEATVALLGTQAIEPEEKVAGIWTGFAEDPEVGLVLEARNVKAMLKESANIMKSLLPVNGKQIALRSKLAERVFVAPHLIPLGRREPDEAVERAIHVMTMQGPRTALKRTDVCRKVSIRCTLKVLNDGIISEDILRAILEHASENGLGTDRSQGNGTFSYTLERRG